MVSGEADPAVTGEVVVADIGIPGAAEVFLGPGDLPQAALKGSRQP